MLAKSNDIKFEQGGMNMTSTSPTRCSSRSSSRWRAMSESSRSS